MSTKVSSPSFIRSQNYENFLVILLRFSLVFVLLLPLVVNSTPFPDTIFPYLMGKALFFRISVEVMFIFWLSLLLINSKYKPKDTIGTAEDRIREIRANIRQRKTLTEGTRNTRDPKTGKDIKEKVPKWETGVADKEREADDRRFTGEKLDSPQDLKGKKGK